MTALPTNVGFGQVVGQFIIIQPDSADGGSDPESTAAVGTISFVPRPLLIKNEDADPNPVTMLPQAVVVSLDSDGYIIDSQGNQGVYLVATNDLDLEPTAWTWQVNFNLTGFKISSFDISVPEGDVIDLTSAIPTQASNGVFYTIRGVPPGGTTGQVLTKVSGVSYNVAWQDPTGGGGGGGEPDPHAASHADGGDDELALDASQITTGTFDDARIPSTITRDTEMTAAISAAISGLIDGAPGALDTLNELAAAVNDDASFAASVTTALNARVAKADYNAHTILAATTDDTPAALTVGEQTVVGRITGGNIAALTVAQIRTLLGITAAAVNLLDDVDAAAMRTTLGLVIGTNVQASDSDLSAIAALTPSNDDVVQRKAGAWTNRTVAQLLADLAAVGTTFQPLDGDLTSIAALTTTSYGRALLELANQAALMALIQAASDTVAGKVELATNAETATGTDTVRAVTPAGLASILGDVATTNQYSDLDGTPALGTAAAADADDFAGAVDTRIECIWNGTSWETNSGGAVPTDPNLLRGYYSLDDPAATTPPWYNVNDTWDKALA